MITIPLTKTFDAMALTNEIVALVPTIRGLTVKETGVEVYRETGDFSKAEESLILAAFSAHDSAAAIQARSQKLINRKQARSALRSANTFAELKDALIKILED